jgi:hypothetical protein
MHNKTVTTVTSNYMGLYGHSVQNEWQSFIKSFSPVCT